MQECSQANATIDIDTLKVKRALDHIIVRLGSQNINLRIFVDGLDEWDAPEGRDRWDLTKQLLEWASVERGSVKICVASREEPSFITDFSPYPKFRLQNLAQHDMEHYVDARLQVITDKAVRDDVMRKIPQKAEGIFLWVRLVVLEIREESMIDDSYRNTNILDRFPPGLKDILDHAMNSIPNKFLSKACQTFDMMNVLQQSALHLSLLAYSFLSDFCENPTIALRETFPRPRF